MGSLHSSVRQTRSRSRSPPEEVPGLIDEIPGLAALAAMQPGDRDDRARRAANCASRKAIASRCWRAGSAALGITVDEYPDGFTIHGGPPAGGEADAAGDHRLAMAFAIAGSRARGAVHITGAEAVAVSYPGFFDELERIARGHVTAIDKIYLVGFMAAGKTTVARPAGGAARLARRGHRRADRSARAADRRRHLRAARRAVLPRRRARDPLRLLLPLRHTVVATGGGTFMDPESQHGDQAGRHVGLARRAARNRRRAPAAGRPPAAVRRSGPDGAAVRDAPGRLRRAPTCASTPPGPPKKSPSAFWTRWPFSKSRAESACGI